MSKRDITIEDLSKIKGLGTTKGEKILEVVQNAEGALATSDLTAISGVSERIAKEVFKLEKNPDGYKPEPPTPRKAKPKAEVEVDPKTKRITKKVTKKATARKVATSTNGSTTRKVKAGDVRRFARDAEKLGLGSLAATLRSRVAPLLDDEKVPADSLN